MIRAPFRRVFAFDLRTGIVLLVAFGLVRMGPVAQANVTGSYQLVSVVFVAMAVLPWVVLTREGRRRVGIVRPSRWRWVVAAAVAGVAALIAVYAVATALWARTVANPFVYIAGTYANVPDSPSGADRLTHLAHFGIVYFAGAWAFLPLPALLWVAATFLSSLVFSASRVFAGSILGAVVAHASFNLAMTVVIFYDVLT